MGRIDGPVCRTTSHKPGDTRPASQDNARRFRPPRAGRGTRRAASVPPGFDGCVHRPGSALAQNAWRTPTATALCEPPAAGAPPAAALLTDTANGPSLAMCPAVAYTAVRLDRWWVARKASRVAFNPGTAAHREQRQVRGPAAAADRRPPDAGQYLDTIHLEEGPLSLTLCALTRAEVHLKPSVRHFMAHLHRAARQLGGSDTR